jgi:hypothetical protein
LAAAFVAGLAVLAALGLAAGFAADFTGFLAAVDFAVALTAVFAAAAFAGLADLVAAGFLAALEAAGVAAVPADLRVAIFMLLEVGRKRPPI